MTNENVSGSSRADADAAELSADQLSRLAPLPRGAAALAGVSVGLLLLAWILIYLLIYLPRGMVG